MSKMDDWIKEQQWNTTIEYYIEQYRVEYCSFITKDETVQFSANWNNLESMVAD